MFCFDDGESESESEMTADMTDHETELDGNNQ